VARTAARKSPRSQEGRPGGVPPGRNETNPMLSMFMLFAFLGFIEMVCSFGWRHNVSESIAESHEKGSCDVAGEANATLLATVGSREECAKEGID
jgi:hypothetical protein